MRRLAAFVVLGLCAACLDFAGAEQHYCDKTGACGTGVPASDGGGQPDAASPDSGSGTDAGGGTDAGNADAGVNPDGGAPDSGPVSAAGWLRTTGDGNTIFQALYALAPAPQGLAVGGTFSGATDFDGTNDVSSSTPAAKDAFIAMYDPTGALLWTRTFAGVNETDTVGLHVDDAGHITAAFNENGGVNVGNGLNDPNLGAAVARFNPDGGAVWLASWSAVYDNNSGAGPSCYSTTLNVNGVGRTLVAGVISGDMRDQNNCPTTGGTGAGGVAWMATLGPDGGCIGLVNYWCGAVQPVGSTNDPAGGDQFLLSQQAGFGNCQPPGRTGFATANQSWLLTHFVDGGVYYGDFVGGLPPVPGQVDNTSPPAAVAFAHNSLWIASSFTGSFQFNDAGASSVGGMDLFLAKVSPISLQATSIWTFGSDGDDTVVGLRADGAGNLWLAGQYKGNGLDFGQGPLPPADGGTQFFLAELNGGTPLYSRAIPVTGGPSILRSLAVSSSGAIFLGGQFFGTVDFGLDGGPAPSTTNPGVSTLFFGQLPF